MKINRKTVLTISVVILIFLSTFIPIYIVFKPKDQRIKHEPIIIWKDDDFKNFEFSGDGSQENPYLIENLEIITDFKYSIYIRNTFKHFVIKNCYLASNEYGIYIDNIADGTAVITENICENNEVGIWISNSENLIVFNNSCSNNGETSGGGIIVTDSSFCNISNNYCYKNNFYGIKVENTEACNIINNTCIKNENQIQGAGIYVFQSSLTLIENNNCSSNRRNGIQVTASSSTNISSNLCEDNYHIGILATGCPNSIISNNFCLRNRNWYKRESHGIVLQYSSHCNITNNLVDSNIGNGIFLESDSNSFISDNLIYNHTGYYEALYSPNSLFFGYSIYCYSSENISVLRNEGISNYGGCWIESSHNMNISSNLFSYSSSYAIEIHEGSNCTIKKNVLSENDIGIGFSNTELSILSNNLVQNSDGYGLILNGSSINNSIHHNSFIGNNLAGTSQGYDEGNDNLWYDNVTKEGNFWSDRISGNYSIDGPSSSEDLYCLEEDPFNYLLNTSINRSIAFTQSSIFNDLTNTIKLKAVRWIKKEEL